MAENKSIGTPLDLSGSPTAHLEYQLLVLVVCMFGGGERII